MPIGKPMDAEDPDTKKEQKLNFKFVAGNEERLFSIEGCDGQISLAEGRTLNFE